MKIAKFHSHLNGREWILVHQPALWQEIEQVVERVDAHGCMTKVSKEKTMKGKLLYSPTELNKCFKAELQKSGWGEGRTDCWVSRDFSGVAIQTCFTQRETDLLQGINEHLGAFTAGTLEVGIEVLAMRSLTNRGISYEDGINMLERSGRNDPRVPMLLVGIGL